MRKPTLIVIVAGFLSSMLHFSLAGLLAEPVNPGGGYSSPNTVPAFPVQTQAPTCHLDLSDELFGGVNEACGQDLDRSRCCPVLAAWLFAAHARSALQLPGPASAPSPAPSSAATSDPEGPMVPDDAQKCVDSLQSALQGKRVKIPQPNATCDTVLCFCGIRLHQVSSLSCPLAFNITSGSRNATPKAAVRNLEKECRNSSYAGCTRCLGALQKLNGGHKKGTQTERASKMMKRDCQLMGLTWLLARNKTEYIPTVSAVLRALLYSAHPHQNKCSPDQENMPLAVDSLQFEKSLSSPPVTRLRSFGFAILPLIVWVSLLVA